MKENNFWRHIPNFKHKKPSLLKRILIIVFSIIGFLVVSCVLIGVTYRPPKSSGEKMVNSATSQICKYPENSSKNILALINEYRISKKLPAFTEYPALSKYQEALLAEMVKNQGADYSELKSITAWQEKYVKTASVIYTENNARKFGVFLAPTPCEALNFFKNNNNNDLLSVNHDSVGIATIGNKTIIILAKKTIKPNQATTVDLNYTNFQIPEYKPTQDSIYTQYTAPTTNYSAEDSNITYPSTTKEKSSEEIQGCVDSYQKELDDLKADYDFDLQSENSRYAQEREQISRDLASRGLAGTDFGGVLRAAKTHHLNITGILKTTYDNQVNNIKNWQQSCST